MISRETLKTGAFDRVGGSTPTSQDGRRLIINALIVLALLALVAYWWFGLR